MLSRRGHMSGPEGGGVKGPRTVLRQSTRGRTVIQFKFMSST